MYFLSGFFMSSGLRLLHRGCVSCGKTADKSHHFLDRESENGYPFSSAAGSGAQKGALLPAYIFPKSRITQPVLFFNKNRHILPNDKPSRTAVPVNRLWKANPPAAFITIERRLPVAYLCNLCYIVGNTTATIIQIVNAPWIIDAPETPRAIPLKQMCLVFWL